MITAKKLLTLKPRTRLRKIAMVLQESAFKAKGGLEVDWTYINEIIPLAEIEGLRTIDNNAPDFDLRKAAFKLEDYGQAILSELGAEPSDWDFRDDDYDLDASRRTVLDRVLVLDRIRSPFNVGSIFRSADSFGIKKIILVEGTASPEHPRSRRTSRGCIDTVQWTFMTEEETLAFLAGYDRKNILALELGGEDMNSFDYPQSGVAVLGSEEFGISPEILKRCGSRISIPMAGTKGSLNVSVATGILLQSWFSHR